MNCATHSWSEVAKPRDAVPITGRSFTDLTPPPGPKLYQVRAARLLTTGSGMFTNLSQAAFLEVN